MPVIGTAAYGELRGDANNILVGPTPTLIGSSIWDAVGEDHNCTSSTTGTITVGVAGIYRIVFTCCSTHQTNTDWVFGIHVNATVTTLRAYRGEHSNIYRKNCEINGFLNLDAGDTVAAYVNSDGAARSFFAYSIRLTAQLIDTA